MARGNWKPEMCKAKPRCRLCGRVVKKSDMVRLDGIAPAHRSCADQQGRKYTIGVDIFLNKPKDET